MIFDMHNKASQLLRKMALALALAACCGAASAGLVHVSIDTSTFGVSSGFIDMELGAAGGPLALATVSNLVGFAATPDIEWGVEQVAGGYKFRSDTVNLLSHAASFGGLLSFDLAFTGDIDPTGSFVSAFKIAAFDGANYLGNFDPATGALATFLWTPSLTSDRGGELSFTVFDASVNVVPEPADVLLMAIGLAAIGMLRLSGKKDASE
jgi:hypothetical protein